MMDKDEFEKLPILHLTPGNEPTSLYPMQEALVPYVDEISIVYWVIFWSVIIFLSSRFVIIPAVKNAIGSGQSPKDDNGDKEKA